MSWLVLNTGSSSLKFALYDDAVQQTTVNGAVNWRGDEARLTIQHGDGAKSEQKCDASDPRGAAAVAIQAVLDAGTDLKAIRGVGHRIVHGGTKFQSSVLIDAAVRADIDQLTALAPLHNPPALEGIAAARAALPNLPQVAVFDTSFFRDLPEHAIVLPVPRQWTDEWGIRKFGFHGISHNYCAIKAAEILDSQDEPFRLVVCHLGNGCSASAILGGKPVETTMSFTPLDGLMMGTRSGSIDPGIVLYLLKEGKIDRDGIDDALNHQSGLVGVSGVASDYQQVEQAARDGHGSAKLALKIYENRVRASIGSLAATLGGIDALVFAAGVGEHSASLRAAVCSGLEFMGLQLDPVLNEAGMVDADIATARSAASILIIHTEEELMIAREVQRIVGAGTDA